MSRFERGIVRAVASILVWGCAMLASAGPEENAVKTVRLEDADAAAAVRKAVAGAHERLGRERCRRIFAEFRDPEGHTLDERLAALGTTGQEFLARVLFYDGSALPVCRADVNREVYAVTERGGRAVRVCARQFQALQRKGPVLGEVVVIHETLHALGLGEGPPSSEDITWQVMQSCG
jgi:hypothetical protein